MRYRFEEVQTLSLQEKLAQVHAAMRQPIKDSVNPHFNSTFASLNECNRVVADAVRSVGDCDYWQRAAYNADAKCWEMQTVFAADGQEEILSSHPFTVDGNPQKTASASTYARRYSMVSAFNLAAEDDDGNQASAPSQPAPQGQQNAYVDGLKRRMWNAIQAWAAVHDITAEQVLEGVRKRPQWSETAEFFEAVAIEFEQDLNG